MKKSTSPKVDPRLFSSLFAELKRLVPHYTPEWPAAEDQDAGVALLKIFSHITEMVINRINRTPYKNFVAFLDMLGIKLLPAIPSRVPIHFKLVPGTQTELFIPKLTQTTAAATERRPEELPFETESDLLAIPSPLVEVIGIDPQNDAIYKPPKGFLEQVLPAENLPAYKISSFSQAGSNTFQLDRIDGLEEGDLLKIGSADPSLNSEKATGPGSLSKLDHVIISSISGGVVKITDPLESSYTVDTPVQKVTKFHLFESKNLQEHILYLGHPDLFSVKSEANFTIHVTHLTGTEVGVEPLDVSWEYWGEIKGEEDEAEEQTVDWRKFEIKNDGSSRLSRNGTIELKKEEGEIKESEINGIGSRWIRCRALKPIPSDMPRKLPELDRITFQIESSGAGLPADQAFNNDNPLDVNLPFLPFGSEPRIFDKFQLASEEIFSKKGAKIEITLELDSRGIIAAPAAISLTDDQENLQSIKVFARGTGGRLVEAEIDPTGQKSHDWRDRGFPEDTTIAEPDGDKGGEAAPAAVCEKNQQGDDIIWVFVKTVDGRLAELFYNGSEWKWLDHEFPNANVKIGFDPHAVSSGVNDVNVFVVGSDGNLYVLERDLGETAKWVPQGTNPDDVALDSSPYAVSSGNTVKVFIKGKDKLLYEWDSNVWRTDPYRPDPIDPFKVDSRPFAQIYEDNGGNFHAKVFVTDEDDTLWELDTKTGNWESLGAPPSVNVASHPHGFIESPTASPENKHIFVRGSDDRLWERTDDTPSWIEHFSPSNSQLRHSPQVIRLSTIDSYFVYSGSNKNSIIERQVRFPVLHTGTAQSGSELTLTLSANASGFDDAYKDFWIVIRGGTGAGQVRRITDYLGAGKVATIDFHWETVPSSSSTYEIYTTTDGTAQDVSDSTIKLAADASSNDDAYNDFQIAIISGERAGQVRRIDAYNGSNKKASIDQAWHPVPDNPPEYLILKSQDIAEGVENQSIKLSTDASNVDDAYNDFWIVAKEGGQGEDQVRRIVDYDGVSKKATVDSAWNPNPPGDAEYEIFTTFDGLAQEGNASIIQLATNASDNKDAYAQFRIAIVDGTGRGQVRRIINYEGNSKKAEITPDWNTVPGNGSKYRILPIPDNAQQGSNPTITLDTGASDVDDAYKNQQVRIISGAGANQTQEIIAYVGGNLKVATVDSNWGMNQIPNGTSRYLILAKNALSIWNEYDDPAEVAITPELSWEFWNSDGWVAFQTEAHAFRDKTKNFLIDGSIEFLLPRDIEPTDVSGQESYWIRARIVSGDYGRETFVLEEREIEKDGEKVKELKLVPTKSPIRPPRISKLVISYKMIEDKFPDKCITFNNLDYIDQTDACKTPSNRFMPFVQLEDRRKTIHLGFANPFKGGPVKIFFAAKELAYTDEKKPKMKWAFRSENAWKPLSVDDATEALIKQEILNLLIPTGFEAVTRFGGSHYWIKGALTEGDYEEFPIISGIFPNTAWSFQAETITGEILGSSDGEPHQTFQFFKFPVREGEKIRVREVLSEEERRALMDKLGEEAVHEIKDENGKLLETWVLWSEVPAFFDSDEKSRHYTLDRAAGQIQFGDGRLGQIPPAGPDDIQAFSYQAGGGSPGNVSAGEIQTLATAVAGVESVINPVEAGGGSDTASLDQMLEIGPAMISHRNRAVTSEDFEWLAREASREIAKVRCLPNTNNKNQKEPGWVTVYIVPDLKAEDRPQPSRALRSAVRRYLEYRCANTVASIDHIFVDGPEYVIVHVEVDVYSKSIDLAAQVDIDARKKLREFLHPLTGGPSGKGWEFGRGIAASDVYVLLEEIEGVDHVEELMFIYDDKKARDFVEINSNALVSNGTHTINVKVIDEAIPGE